MKNIVVSGSMQFVGNMKEYAKQLRRIGYMPILPEEDHWDLINSENINEYKKIVSKKHFDLIADPKTYAILVVNEPKKGIKNYIGANTFAEIAIAFYFGKKIYLVNDIYKPFADELTGWDAVPLLQDLQKIEL